jgi:hypothetical protein
MSSLQQLAAINFGQWVGENSLGEHGGDGVEEVARLALGPIPAVHLLYTNTL